MAARRSSLWFGYLEAGEKTSPVVRDSSLSTGNRATMYLFNFNKGRILEYRQDIVESKLRELTDEETFMTASLRDAFMKVRNTFEPRGAVRLPPPPRRPMKEPELEEDDVIILDDDALLSFAEDD
jgi:hypothetical protein